MEILKERRVQHPQEAVHNVNKKALGAIHACKGVGKIPRNSQQANDLVAQACQTRCQ